MQMRITMRSVGGNVNLGSHYFRVTGIRYLSVNWNLCLLHREQPLLELPSDTPP